MTATYDDQIFGTPLLARWAAFFDLAGWRWSTSIAPVGNWKPDFRVSFDCGHSECGGSHTILVTVLSVDDMSGVQGHPALSHAYGIVVGGQSVADAGALFGSSPAATLWEMGHGAGGGAESVTTWVDEAAILWRKAEHQVQTLT